VKETAKTASYLGVILAGVGVTAVIFYQVFRELFSSKSPNSVYTTSLKKCCKDPRVIDSLGEPIKGFGEETRRGRRRHVRYVCGNTQEDQSLLSYVVAPILSLGYDHCRSKFM
jgi:import inner membrane translocase subunit TIM21